MQLFNCFGCPILVLSALPVSFALVRDQSHNITSQEAAELAVTYAYPLLAFKTVYLSLSPLIRVNHLGHARQLSTSTSDSVVKPNVDTLYSTAIYDLSHEDLMIDIPAIPATQHNTSTTTLIDHDGELQAAPKAYIKSPTTFGLVMVRWLVAENNINTVHLLQNSTIIKPVPKSIAAEAYNWAANPRLNSVRWNETGSPPGQDALRLLCQLKAPNTPGQIAGNFTVGEILSKSGACVRSIKSTNIDFNAADTSAMAAANMAGQDASRDINNGWSVVRNDLAANFGTDYALRTEIAETGYLMLKTPEAVYPSWSNGTATRSLEGELLQLGANESYMYTFLGKPPLRKLGFWSLTVYDGDGFLIPNPWNVSSLGDRSNITYTSGEAVYGPDSEAEQDGAFQLLIQPADLRPPGHWTGNWLPGPSGGGNMTSLLRFFGAADDLLDGTYQYPVVTKQQAMV